MPSPPTPPEAPDPVTVWLWRRGLRTGVEGRLELSPTHVSFRAGDDSVVIPGPAIRGVRKGLGTPVLTVTFEEEGKRREVSFFFSFPPPLEPERPYPGWVPGRGMERTVAAMRLRAADRDARPTVGRWLRAIRAMRRRERRGGRSGTEGAG